MKELIGTLCKIHMKVDGKHLYYTGTIKEVTDSDFTFLDKFGDLCTHNRNNVVEIKQERRGGRK